MLKRTPIATIKTPDDVAEPVNTGATGDTAKGEEKKVIKLNVVLSAEERAKLRAQKFAVVDDKKIVDADEKVLKRRALFDTAGKADAKKQKRAHRRRQRRRANRADPVQ